MNKEIEMDIYDKIMVIAMIVACGYISTAVMHKHIEDHVKEYHQGIKR